MKHAMKKRDNANLIFIFRQNFHNYFAQPCLIIYNPPTFFVNDLVCLPNVTF